MEISKAYNPKEFEDKIYQNWQDKELFNPDKMPDLKIRQKNGSFSIVLPPPNVTGTLHLGHAAMLAIEDLVVRYKRMKGFDTVWVPGTDHAAIATQNVVEKKLFKNEGKTRHDFGKENFLEKVGEHVAESKNTIKNQVRKMGSSLDWSREAYTLDEVRSKAVRKVFTQMYNDGLIYRGDRVVNWCPRCHSTLADDEVEYKEQKAKVYTFKYSKDFPFLIATTRPETKLGDTAVAVNPKDERYKDYIGKEFEVDFCGVPLKLKVIADWQVDMDFGTGALGVTPAHSMVDWQMAEQNNLPIIKVIDENGNIHQGFGGYSGKSALEAREMIVKKLKAQGLLEKEEEIDNKLSVCYRCKTPIEPLPSKQWFVDVNKKVARLDNKSLKERAIQVATDNEINFLPERFKKSYSDWMENLHDWCISRQIWFGHQIPVWYKNNSKVWNFGIGTKEIFDKIKSGEKIFESRVGRERSEIEKNWEDLKPNDVIEFSLTDGEGGEVIESGLNKRIKNVYHFNSLDEMFDNKHIKENIDASKNEYQKYLEKRFDERMKKYGIWVFELENININEEQIYVGEVEPQGEGWQQDPDTLDTWFSSGLWTFTTLLPKDWDGQNFDSPDIKRFHPTSLMETGYDILFFWVARMILMTTYVMQEVPFKNVFLHGLIRDKDGEKMSKSKPETAIDPLEAGNKYGFDAVRLSLLIGNTAGNDLRLYDEKIEGYRNFVNKLWNISRFILINIDLVNLNTKVKANTLADKWILSKFNKLKLAVGQSLDAYNFSSAGELLKDFTWNDLADWYLEIAKVEKDKEAILFYILKELLQMWHPFTPFVTQAIWDEAKLEGELMISAWPEATNKFIDDSIEQKFDIVKEIITKIRNLRAEYNVPPAKRISLIINGQETLLKKETEVIKFLARVEDVKFSKEKPDNSASFVLAEVEVYMPLADLVDADKEKERLSKEKDDLAKYIIGLSKKLDNQEFVANAPKAVVRKEQDKLAEAKLKIEKIEEQLNIL